MAGKKGTRSVCLACECERRFISAEPVRRGYEISNYECPCCKTILRLAQKTSQRTQYEDELRSRRRGDVGKSSPFQDDPSSPDPAHS